MPKIIRLLNSIWVRLAFIVSNHLSVPTFLLAWLLSTPTSSRSQKLKNVCADLRYLFSSLSRILSLDSEDNSLNSLYELSTMGRTFFFLTEFIFFFALDNFTTEQFWSVEKSEKKNHKNIKNFWSARLFRPVIKFNLTRVNDEDDVVLKMMSRFRVVFF